MSVFFIAGIMIPQGEAGEQERGDYDSYIEQVRPVVERFGGKYRLRSESVTHLAGDWKPDRVIVIEFPSREDLTACFESPEYRWIESMRTGSVASGAIIVDA